MYPPRNSCPALRYLDDSLSQHNCMSAAQGPKVGDISHTNVFWFILFSVVIHLPHAPGTKHTFSQRFMSQVFHLFFSQTFRFLAWADAFSTRRSSLQNHGEGVNWSEGVFVHVSQNEGCMVLWRTLDCSSIRVYFWDAAQSCNFFVIWREKRVRVLYIDILWMRGNLMESIKICLAQTHTYLTNTLSVACNFTQVHHSYFSLMPGLTQMQTQLLPACSHTICCSQGIQCYEWSHGQSENHVMSCLSRSVLFRITAKQSIGFGSCMF